MVYSRDIAVRTVLLIVAILMMGVMGALPAGASQPANGHDGHAGHVGHAGHAGHASHDHHASTAKPRPAAASQQAAHREGQAAQPAGHDHHADHSAQSDTHCPISLAPVHCEICLDRDVVQASGLRHRERVAAVPSWQDKRLVRTMGAMPPGPGPGAGAPTPARPPDGLGMSARSSRPLLLAHRFRI